MVDELAVVVGVEEAEKDGGVDIGGGGYGDGGTWKSQGGGQ